MKKTRSVLGKLMIAVLCVIFGVILLENKGIQAAEEGTVRVSTQKQLNKAIKDPDVKTIIFRTKAEITVKIKAAEEAKTKAIIIDAPRAVFYNKAVFSSITLTNVGAYHEQVSGNDIIVSYDEANNWLYISKNKKVNSLTINSKAGIFDGNIFVRKGAKIKTLNLNYTGGEEVISGVYDPETDKITIDFTDADDVKHSVTVSISKKGEIFKIESKSDNEEDDYSYFKIFDEYGNIVKVFGETPQEGLYLRLMEFTPDTKLIKQEVFSEKQSTSVDCEYDEKGERIKETCSIVDYVDGIKYITDYTYTFTYDEKGHNIGRVFEATATGDITGYYEEERTYNSKGFLTKCVQKYLGNYFGDTEITIVATFKYNKAGDMVKVRYQRNDEYIVGEVIYDELGERIDANILDYNGDLEVLMRQI